MKLMLTLLMCGGTAMANPMMIEDFSESASTRWSYTSDRVMGGVSDGGAALGSEGGLQFAQLRGTVSTANNGGFIQIRHQLETPLPADADAISLQVRGNGATYYVHLRPKASRRPWQFYQAAFETTADWETITLPWEQFSPQGGLDASFAPQDILSIGIVAYGADYEAVLDVDWIGTQ